MKQEEFMESIYGCLERIENKINGLSMPQSAGGDAEADKEVIQELNALKTGFKTCAGGSCHDQGRYSQSTEKKLHAGQVHGNPVCIEKRTAGVPQESERVPGTVRPNRERHHPAHIGEDGIAFYFRQEQDGRTRCCLSQTQHQHRYTLYILDPDHTGNVLDSCICGFLHRKAT